MVKSMHHLQSLLTIGLHSPKLDRCQGCASPGDVLRIRSGPHLAYYSPCSGFSSAAAQLSALSHQASILPGTCRPSLMQFTQAFVALTCSSKHCASCTPNATPIVPAHHRSSLAPQEVVPPANLHGAPTHCSGRSVGKACSNAHPAGSPPYSAVLLVLPAPDPHSPTLQPPSLPGHSGRPTGNPLRTTLEPRSWAMTHRRPPRSRPKSARSGARPAASPRPPRSWLGQAVRPTHPLWGLLNPGARSASCERWLRSRPPRAWEPPEASEHAQPPRVPRC